MNFENIYRKVRGQYITHGNFFFCNDFEVQVYSPDNVCDLTFIISHQQEPIAKLIFCRNNTVTVYLKAPSKAHSIDYKGFSFSTGMPISQVMAEPIAKDYPLAPAVYQALSAILH